MLSPIRLSSVCNVRAPYSGGSDFRQCIPDMTYNVFSGTLNPTQSVSPGECRRLQFSCDCILVHLTNKIIYIFHPSICEDFSVIRSLKLYAILLPTRPDFSSSIEVRQTSCMGLVTLDDTVSRTRSVLLLVANN